MQGRCYYKTEPSQCFGELILRKRLCVCRLILTLLQCRFAIGKESAMYQSSKPDREQVRQWLRHEIALHRPPPDPREIRRQLGWHQAGGEQEEAGRGRR